MFFTYVPPSLQTEMPMGQMIIDGSSNTAVFARAMMKIAYCHTVAQLGLDGFRKLYSRQIILGSYPFISHFIGCDFNEKPKSQSDITRHFIERNREARWD